MPECQNCGVARHREIRPGIHPRRDRRPDPGAAGGGVARVWRLLVEATSGPVGRRRGVGFEYFDPTLGTPDERVTRRLPVPVVFGERTDPLGAVGWYLPVVASDEYLGTILTVGFIS